MSKVLKAAENHVRKRYYQLRLTDEEYTKLTAVAKQMSLTRSGYIRSAIDIQYQHLQKASHSYEKVVVMEQKSFAPLHLELCRQGNNYNQAVRAINTIAKLLRGLNVAKFSSDDIDSIKVFAAELKAVKEGLKQGYQNTADLVTGVEEGVTLLEAPKWKRDDQSKC